MHRAFHYEQQRLEVTERHYAIDRSSCGEGNKQSIGATCGTFDSLRGSLDARKALFEIVNARLVLNLLHWHGCRLLRDDALSC